MWVEYYVGIMEIIVGIGIVVGILVVGHYILEWWARRQDSEELDSRIALKYLERLSEDIDLLDAAIRVSEANREGRSISDELDAAYQKERAEQLAIPVGSDYCPNCNGVNVNRIGNGYFFKCEDCEQRYDPRSHTPS